MTWVFGGCTLFAYSMAQGIALVPLLILSRAGGAAPNHALMAGQHVTGLSLAVANAVSCPVMLLACGLLAGARRGIRVGDYLALRPVPARVLMGWTFGMLALALSLSALNEWFGHPPSDFMVAIYATAGVPAWFWTAVAVLAPVAEETFFRGFLFPGWMASRLRGWGTVLLTSVVFMLAHAGQYGWIDMVQVGLTGLALGIARLRSGSLFPPLAMHVTLNLTALTLFALQKP